MPLKDQILKSSLPLQMWGKKCGHDVPEALYLNHKSHDPWARV